MFCPFCGNKLEETQIIEERPSEPDWEDPIAVAMYYDVLYKTRDLSTHLICSQGCFSKSLPLVMHHPHRGKKSRPGDSWSLTWER